MSARYHLITRLRLDVDRSRTWDALADVGEWPRWWKWLDRVDVIREGDGRGEGAVFRHTIRSPLLYGFTWQTETVRVVEESVVELHSTGALEGRGRFEVSGGVGAPTDVVFTWLVRTNKPWMRAMSPLARSVFTWSHDRLMGDFARGVAAAAGGRLLSLSHQAVHPREDGFYRMSEFEG